MSFLSTHPNKQINENTQEWNKLYFYAEIKVKFKIKIAEKIKTAQVYF